MARDRRRNIAEKLRPWHGSIESDLPGADEEERSVRKFGVVTLAIVGLAFTAGLAQAQTKPAAKKTTRAQPANKVQPDQSYLYLDPSSAPRSGGPNYVTQGMRESNQPYFNTGGWPDGTQPWSNR